MDPSTAQVLRRHLARQRLSGTLGEYVFTDRAGRALRPTHVTHAFAAQVRRCALPPVRLHDLRHGAATLALAAGVDLKTVQDMLGHASIVTTADTYTSVLPEVHHAAAEAIAALVLKTGTPNPPRRRREVEALR